MASKLLDYWTFSFPGTNKEENQRNDKWISVRLISYNDENGAFDIDIPPPQCLPHTLQLKLIQNRLPNNG